MPKAASKGAIQRNLQIDDRIKNTVRANSSPPNDCFKERKGECMIPQALAILFCAFLLSCASGGCHTCVWEGPVQTVGRDGSQHVLNPHQLCGDAESGRPIRPGVPRRMVGALLGSTPGWDRTEVDYRLSAPAVFLYFADIEYGLIGFDRSPRSYTLRVEYDERGFVRRCEIRRAPTH